MAYVSEPLIDYPILLTGRVGTLGSVFRVPTPCWPSDNTLILCAQLPHAFEYLYFSLKRVDLVSLNRGSTQPLLTQSDLKRQALLRPPDGLLAEFHLIARGLFGRIDHAEAESRAIARLRDTLLPQLLCGSVGGHLPLPAGDTWGQGREARISRTPREVL